MVEHRQVVLRQLRQGRVYRGDGLQYFGQGPVADLGAAVGAGYADAP